MIKLLKFAATFFLLCSGTLNAQLTYNNSILDVAGEPMSLPTNYLNVHNAGTGSVQVVIKRTDQNLPADWFTCFCFINCYPPTADSIIFNLQPDETAPVGLLFTSSEVPGYGSCRLIVKIVGNPLPADTFNLSGSTLMTGIAEHSTYQQIKCFPNPFKNELNIEAVQAEPVNIYISDAKGTVIKEIILNHGNLKVDLSSYAGGIYQISGQNRAGNAFRKTVIKEQ